MTREEIIAAARTYIGIPWIHEGRTRGGLDCVGLVCAVATDLGIPFEDRKGYDRTPVGFEFLSHLRKYLTLAPPGSTTIGSIGVIRQSRYPCHVGIFGEQGGTPTFIHAYLPRHQVVEETWTPARDFGLLMTLNYPGVED